MFAGRDPTKIIQRSAWDTPLMAPLGAFGRAWEVGTSPYPCNTGNVIFLPSAVRMAAPGRVRVWFGAADAVTGTGVIEVTKLPPAPGSAAPQARSTAPHTEHGLGQ